MSISVADAILIANLALEIGEELVTKLEDNDNETITRDELIELLSLPDFRSFSAKKRKEKGEE